MDATDPPSEGRTRREVAERSGGLCEVTGARAEEMSHRVAEGRGGRSPGSAGEAGRMTVTEALAYDASPSGPLACEHWCQAVGHGDCCRGECDCGMERTRTVIATLQAALRGGAA